jgi:CO/xanthine dehydrogenase FAD-binding subunit
MKPPPFDYERPANTNAALASLANHGGRAKVLAGGQSLLPMLNLRLVSPEYLIDISRLDELKYIRVADNELRIGALTTHNTVLKSADVAARCPIMVEAYRQVSHHSVRNRGTIGGSLCHNDPAAEMPLVINLLGALLVARSKNGERVVSAEQFFRGHFETALEDDELLTEIRIPIPAKGHGWSFQEVSQRKGDFALVAAAALLTLENGTCRDVRLGFRNVGERIFRLNVVEAQIEGQSPSERLFAAAASAAMDAVDPPSDLHADADYRRDLVEALTERVLAKALERARN